MMDTYFKNRMLDLAERADSQHIYTYSHFLSLPEQNDFLALKPDLPSVCARLEGFHASAIRKIAVFGSEDELGYSFESPVRILHIRPRAEKFAEELSHRDYLGSVMALGIEREMTGDIIIRRKEAWILVFDSIAEYILDNLFQVRHTNVSCEIVSGEVPQLQPSFESLHMNLASERIDLLIAAAANVKREAAKKLLSDEKVFVNGKTVLSAGYKLKAGDELVIRGSGKFIYDGIESETKKGRINIRLRKYR